MSRRKQKPPALTPEEIQEEHEAFDREFNAIYDAYRRARAVGDHERCHALYYQLYRDLKDRERQFLAAHPASIEADAV
jgi:hypothetical protein